MIQLSEIYENECLIINYDKRPKKLDKICNKYERKASISGLSYKNCAKWLKKVGKLGFTFSYGLDAEPYNLMKIKKYKELQEQEKNIKKNKSITKFKIETI